MTGGQQVFDLFLGRFTRFDLVTVDGALIPDGVPCFSGGWPDEVLAAGGVARGRSGRRSTRGCGCEVWRRR